MPIAFFIGSSVHDRDASPYVVYQPELDEYLYRLKPHVDMAALTDLDPYGDKVFTADDVTRLQSQLDALEEFLRSLFEQQTLSAELEPPQVGGLESDPERLGRQGTLRFVTDLKALIAEARRRGRPVIALGD